MGGTAISEQWPLLVGTILTGGLEAVGVLLASVGVVGGAVACWAWLKGEEPRAIAEAGTIGGVYGFIIGAPLAICAAYLLHISS